MFSETWTEYLTAPLTGFHLSTGFAETDADLGASPLGALTAEAGAARPMSESSSANAASNDRLLRGPDLDMGSTIDSPKQSTDSQGQARSAGDSVWINRTSIARND